VKTNHLLESIVNSIIESHLLKQECIMPTGQDGDQKPPPEEPPKDETEDLG